jgi:hypothetical protein
MNCNCKICLVHVIVRVLKVISTRCKAAAKALVGK